MLSSFVQTCDNGEGGSVPSEVSYFFNIFILDFLTSGCTAFFNIPLTHSKCPALGQTAIGPNDSIWENPTLECVKLVGAQIFIFFALDFKLVLKPEV
jgi:hypothetical protein